MELAGMIVWGLIGLLYLLSVVSRRKRRESNIHPNFKVFNKKKY
jgi:hypothetical protein